MNNKKDEFEAKWKERMMNPEASLSLSALLEDEERKVQSNLILFEGGRESDRKEYDISTFFGGGRQKDIQYNGPVVGRKRGSKEKQYLI